MLRKYFPLDKNYLLEEAQLSLQDSLLSALVERARDQFEWEHNPLGLMDSFSFRIKSYVPKSLKPLQPFYQTLAGIYRYRYGHNQLEFLWNGKSHLDEYKEQWSLAFAEWINEFARRPQFIQAVLDLTVFLPENRSAHLAENRMNFVLLEYFSQKEGFPALKVKKTRGVLEIA